MKKTVVVLLVIGLLLAITNPSSDKLSSTISARLRAEMPEDTVSADAFLSTLGVQLVDNFVKACVNHAKVTNLGVCSVYEIPSLSDDGVSMVYLGIAGQFIKLR